MQAASWGCFLSKNISAEDELHGGFKGSAIGLVEPAEGFAHEALIEGGEDRLDGGDLQELSRLPVCTMTSPKVAGERTWLVMAIKIRSGRSVW
jgi:hypothetical protein